MKLYLEKLKLRVLIALIYILGTSIIIIEFIIRVLMAAFSPLLWIFTGKYYENNLSETFYSVVLVEIYIRKLESKL